MVLLVTVCGRCADIASRLTCMPPLCSSAAAVNVRSPCLMCVQLVSVLLYLNEEDLMHVRLLEHYEAVDLFVVVEAPFTFTGNPKPLHFGEALCRRFERFTAKIVHVVTDFPDAVWKAQPVKAKSRFANDAWRREFAIRVRRAGCRMAPPLHGCQPATQLSSIAPPTPPHPPPTHTHTQPWPAEFFPHAGAAAGAAAARPAAAQRRRRDPHGGGGAAGGQPAVETAWPPPTPACRCPPSTST